MAKEWQTFVRKFGDMKEGDIEIFIKDLTPGPRKYDTKHVTARVSKSKNKLPQGDILWIRSESGSMLPEPWYMEIKEELPEWVEGRPWEDVFEAIERAQARRA
ncbi:MAG: hypothetical protein JRJ03_16170 [Deltaproteobacteria bacterium]|nr:hypothetical protein [Deltaproteobacteria bacterium]